MTRGSKSTWQRMRLNEICTKGKSTLRQKDLPNDGHYPVYGASGVVGGMAEYQNAIPYVAIVKDGAGVGRVYACEAKSSVLGTMQALVPNERTERDYLFHLLRSLKLGEGFSGSTIPHIYFKDYGKRVVPFPDLAEQKDIAKQLNFIDSGISRVQVQIDKLDALVKSRFVEMFGDPADNPFGWNTAALTDLGVCKNGMNFRASDFGYNVACLGVADFKDRSVIDDMSLLGTVNLDAAPSDNYLLKNGDIVFVRSNGNKQLVGRCLAVYPGNQEVVFSGFCIRLRLNNDQIRVPFLLWALKQPSIRRQMFGRGANVQNLNQKILSNVRVPVPPIALQEEFLGFATQVDKSKSIAQKQIDKLQMLYDSLAQEYFGD